MPKVIGIDPGTTTSVIAIRGGQAGRHRQCGRHSNQPLRHRLSKSQERLVGELAKRQAVYSQAQEQQQEALWKAK